MALIDGQLREWRTPAPEIGCSYAPVQRVRSSQDVVPSDIPGRNVRRH